MEALSSSMVIQHSNPLHRFERRSYQIFTPFHKPTSQITRFSYLQRNILRRRWCYTQICFMNLKNGEGVEEEEGGEEDVDKAINMDGSISGSSNEFVERVSSKAYNMRRSLQQTVDTSSYDGVFWAVSCLPFPNQSHRFDASGYFSKQYFGGVLAVEVMDVGCYFAVLEANPWRDKSKPVYVLTHDQNQLCTMKIRRPRSEVEGELEQLFTSKGDKLKNNDKHSGEEDKDDSKFHMLVEDIREGVLVFEDAKEAASYCDLLQGSGQECENVAEIEASWVFDLCRQSRALAVLFRRGRTPPLPESLKLYLRARQRSLED